MYCLSWFWRFEYHFLFSFVALFAYFWVFGPFTIKETCIVFRKSACPFGQVKTKMYLSKSPYFKKSLAYSGKWKLKYTCQKALLSKSHLPGQAGKYLCRCLEVQLFVAWTRWSSFRSIVLALLCTITGTNISFRSNFPCWQVVNDFYLPNINFWLAWNMS